MGKDANETKRQVIESDQHADTFLSLSLEQGVHVRLCSVRCQESQIENAPNQDYVRVVFTPGGSSLSFCVCDGVGGSYLGNFAARYLAVRLTGALLDLPKIPPNPSRTAAVLRKSLRNWAAAAQKELRSLPLPPALSSLQGEILEEQRDQYGSATVFFCGRVDYLCSPATRKDAASLQALFCWMGNVTARAFLSPSIHVNQRLGDKGNDRNRWSTRLGQQGRLSMRTCELSRTQPLIIHTDGLDELEYQLAHQDDDQLQMQIQRLLRLPANDDMTLLELRWQEEGKA